MNEDELMYEDDPEDDDPAIPACDRSKDDADVVEIIAVHLYHPPDNERDVNGLTCVLRSGDQEFTFGVREGVEGKGVEMKPAVPFDTGGPQYMSLVADRHELLGSVEEKLAEAAPQIVSLFASFRSSALKASTETE